MGLRSALLAVILPLTPACLAAEEPLDPGEPMAGPPVSGHEIQGRTYLGDLDDLASTTEHYWLSTAATLANNTAATVSVQNGRLRVTQGATTFGGMDTRILGLRLTGSDSKTVTIKSFIPPNAATDDPLQYVIERDGVDPCNGEGVIAVAGRYTIDGVHQAPNSDITLACAKGVVHKCFAWKYDPGTNPTSDRWALNQSCTWMAGARYCRADTYTREGTSVSMFDALGVRAPFPNDPNDWVTWSLPATTWPPPKGQYYVEAAWFDDDDAKCISRGRWASLPRGFCGLPDPRYDPTAQYCEDMIEEHSLVADEPWIVNLSLFNDLAFTTWETPGGDKLSTVRGLHEGDRGTHPPYAGMVYRGESGVLLRELTAEMLPEDVVLLGHYCVPGTKRCVVTTDGAPPPQHTEYRGAEGYVFVAKRPGTMRLRLWSNGTDYVSAISPPAGYTEEGDLGWIFVVQQ